MFFAEAAVGLSPDRSGALEAIELAARYELEPVQVDRLRSTWFDEHFPPGTLELDGGFVMRDVPARWRAVRR